MQAHYPWYALTVHPKHEHLAARGCGVGVRVLRAAASRAAMVATAPKTLDVALFPGYVFWPLRYARQTARDDRSFGARHRAQRPRSRPVDDARNLFYSTLISSGRPIDVCPFLSVGQHVRIHHGPFESVRGVIVRADDNWRVMLASKRWAAPSLSRSTPTRFCPNENLRLLKPKLLPKKECPAAIPQPRNRVVLFRLTQEEFEEVQQACAGVGSRSVSEYARARILGLTETTSLGTLENKLSDLSRAVTHLTNRGGNCQRSPRRGSIGELRTVPREIWRLTCEPCCSLLASLVLAFAQTRPAVMEDVGKTNLPAQRLGVDDLVAVSVYDAPELTRTVRVEPDGMVHLHCSTPGSKRSA